MAKDGAIDADKHIHRTLEQQWHHLRMAVIIKFIQVGTGLIQFSAWHCHFHHTALIARSNGAQCLMCAISGSGSGNGDDGRFEWNYHLVPDFWALYVILQKCLFVSLCVYPVAAQTHTVRTRRLSSIRVSRQSQKQTNFPLYLFVEVSLGCSLKPTHSHYIAVWRTNETSKYIFQFKCLS